MTVRGLSAPQMAAEVAAVVVTWLAAYKLNEWLFTGLLYDHIVYWIFLPAALRVLAVLLFSWRGALGLFIGALLTYTPLMSQTPVGNIALAAASALGPLLGVGLISRWFGIPADLFGLTITQLALMCCAGAAASAGAHTLLIAWQEGKSELIWNFFPMFSGDLAGTLLVVYAVHFVLRVWFPEPSDKRV
jgi:hypothetical protein